MIDEPTVYLSSSAVIPDAKIAKCLLMPLPKDDKSKLLAQAGYTLDNWQQLKKDLQTQVLTQPARFIETNRYGDKYEICARLTGQNEVSLDVLIIWIVNDGTTRFVTLVPDK